MSVLWWIVLSGVGMSMIALIGGITFFIHEQKIKKVMLPLVALAAGSMIGGAFLHMIPKSVTWFQKNAHQSVLGADAVYIWVLLGFTTFFALEQFLHWHHCGRAESECKKPLTYLVLIGDGLHNFIGGLAVAGTFIIDVRLGFMAFLAAAAHELPQELGDFAVLVNGGWKKSQALLFNFLSSLTFLLGGLVAYLASFSVDIAFLIPFAAGNFLYIGATDLVPEVNKHSNIKNNIVHFMMFVLGVFLMWLVKAVAS